MLDVRPINFAWKKVYPIFLSPNYLEASSPRHGWIGGFAGNELKVVVSYVIKRKLVFTYATLQTEPYWLNDCPCDQMEKVFLNGVMKCFKSMKVDFVAQPPTHAVFRICPDGAIAAPFGSYFLDLCKPLDALWAGIHSKHRNVIRNAQNKGVEIVTGGLGDIDTVHQLLQDTMRRSSMGFMTRNALYSLAESLQENVVIFIARHEGIAQGCAMMPFSTHAAYYLFGGSIEAPLLGSMNLLHWEAIKYFQSMGVKYYDFVGARICPPQGSKLEGIQRFKSRFGSSLRTGYLWKASLSYKYNMYRLIQMARHRGGGDIIDQERKRIEKTASNV